MFGERVSRNAHMSEEENEKVSEVLRLLYDEGLESASIVNNIVSKEITSNKENSWLQMKDMEEFTDDHFVYGALSEMSFPPGTFVAPKFITRQLVDIGAAAGFCGTRKEGKNTRVQETSEKLKATFSGHDQITYFVPVTNKKHWGVCVAYYSRRKGRVRWGDSMGKKDHFINTARALSIVMDEIFGHTNSLVVRSNLMFEEMRFIPQTDRHSCGFYVIAAIATYARSLGCLEGYGFTEKCCSVIGETLRGQALKCYFARVTEAFDIFKNENPESGANALSRQFTEFHVFRHINRNRLGHVFGEQSMQPLETTPCASNGVEISNPVKYINELNMGGARFRMDKKQTTTPSLDPKIAVARAYSCERDAGNCPAKVFVNFWKDRRIFGVRKGLHSHGP